MNDEVFKGVKVADFSWVVVGPLTTRYLAAHGATVVRVESMQRPDVVRTSRPFKGEGSNIDRSGYYAFYNANKYSLSLNLNNPYGLEVVKRLVAWADIVTENFAPGMMERWGLSYAELKTGTIRFNGQDVPTVPLSSYVRALEIAHILKGWIENGEFFLTEPQEMLPTAEKIQAL